MNDIHAPFVAFYREAMLWHSSSAHESIAIFAAWLSLLEEGDAGRANAYAEGPVFDDLHNILHQAGCLSRYFFPARKAQEHIGRAGHLREIFSVEQDSPLSDRAVRDALEHFDERLDRYLLGHVVGIVRPTFVGHVLPESEVPLHVFKGLELATLNFVLLNKRYPMIPLIEELERVHSLLIDAE